MKHALALLPILLAAPAIAAEPTFGPGFAWEVVHYTGPSIDLPTVPVSQITIGDVGVTLEVTEMADIVAAFGGEIHRQGEAGEAAAWLCYTRGDRTFWFYSDGEMGGGKVNMVAVDDTPRASAGAGCLEAPRAFDSIDFGVRTFGDWMSVMATFGKVEPAEDGTFGYATIDEVTRDGRPYYIGQELVYRLERDHIVAVAVLQVSGD